jgi:hypothetical protein
MFHQKNVVRINNTDYYHELKFTIGDKLLITYNNVDWDEMNVFKSFSSDDTKKRANRKQIQDLIKAIFIMKKIIIDPEMPDPDEIRKLFGWKKP